jgi:hypothetical protein
MQYFIYIYIYTYITVECKHKGKVAHMSYHAMEAYRGNGVMLHKSLTLALDRGVAHFMLYIYIHIYIHTHTFLRSVATHYTDIHITTHTYEAMCLNPSSEAIICRVLLTMICYISGILPGFV